jgi:hypothetical protein
VPIGWPNRWKIKTGLLWSVFESLTLWESPTASNAVDKPYGVVYKIRIIKAIGNWTFVRRSALSRDNRFTHDRAPPFRRNILVSKSNTGTSYPAAIFQLQREGLWIFN